MLKGFNCKKLIESFHLNVTIVAMFKAQNVSKTAPQLMDNSISFSSLAQPCCDLFKFWKHLLHSNIFSFGPYIMLVMLDFWLVQGITFIY
jgi:hypothetical protein